MTSPLGLNIFTWNTATRAVCDKLQPAALLLLNNDGGAAEAATRYPACKVIARVVNDHEEKHLHETPGATRRYLQMRAGQTSRSVYVNLGCEAPTDRLHDLISETVDGLNWCVENRVKVAAPHGAFYAINPPDFPTLDPLVDLICAHPDLFLFSVDEYSGGHAFSGVVDAGVPGGNEVGHIQPEHWKAGPVPAKWQDTQYWHAGRITNYFRYRKALGKPLPLTVITENGMDALGDIAAWLKSLHNTGSADGTRGWQTLSPQWRDWYDARGWSGDVAYAEMMAAQWREIYAPWPNVLGGCLYAYGTNGDPQWDSYRLDGHDEFFDHLVKMNWKGTPVPAPPIELKHTPPPTTPAVTRVVTMNASGFTSANVRAEPTTAAAIVGTVKVGDSISIRVPTKTVTANNYLWIYCDAPAGWIANVVSFAEPRTIVKHVALGVPFVTQNRQGQNNLCAEACIAMLARYRAAQVGDSQWANVTALDVAAKIPDRPAGGTTDYEQATKAAAVFGLTLLKAAPSSEDIIGQIDAGLPVIVDFIRKFIPGWQRIYADDPDGPHLAVADEYTIFSDNSVEFGIEDPLGFEGAIGDNYQVKAPDLLAGMAATKYAATALLLDAKSIAPMPPPETDNEPRLWTMREIVALVDARIGAK